MDRTAEAKKGKNLFIIKFYIFSKLPTTSVGTTSILSHLAKSSARTLFLSNCKKLNPKNATNGKKCTNQSLFSTYAGQDTQNRIAC
ncbi:MAG: hypothetical protein LBS52_04170 [Dysgonamonadaceae bacterium]|nr:hypothetical protein [Dysgonamonadaceae bacterium]